MAKKAKKAKSAVKKTARKTPHSLHDEMAGRLHDEKPRRLHDEITDWMKPPKTRRRKAR